MIHELDHFTHEFRNNKIRKATRYEFKNKTYFINFYLMTF